MDKFNAAVDADDGLQRPDFVKAYDELIVEHGMQAQRWLSVAKKSKPEGTCIVPTRSFSFVFVASRPSQLPTDAMGQHVFDIFDKNHDHTVDRLEMLCGLTLLCKGTPQQKVEVTPPGETMGK